MEYTDFPLWAALTSANWWASRSLSGGSTYPASSGAKAIHLTTPEERKTALKLEQLRIDLGPDGSGLAKVGDRAGFATRFSEFGPSIRAKALDNRLGVFNLIELLRSAPENIDLLAAFTVRKRWACAARGWRRTTLIRKSHRGRFHACQ